MNVVCVIVMFAMKQEVRTSNQSNTCHRYNTYFSENESESVVYKVELQISMIKRYTAYL